MPLDLSNWNQTINTLQTGNAQVQQSLQQNAQTKASVGGQQFAEASATAGTVQAGLDGIADQIDKTKQLEMQRQELQMRQRAADDAHETHTVMLPLQRDMAEENIANAKVDNRIKLDTASHMEWSNKRTEDQAEETDAGVAASYTGRKPAGWYDMTPQQKSAWVQGNTTQRTAQANLGKVYADTGLINTETKGRALEAQGQDIKNATDILHLSRETALQGAYGALARDPTQATQLDVMRNPALAPIAKERSAKLDKLAASTSDTAETIDNQAWLAGLGGTEVDRDGHLKDPDAWIRNIGGVNGLLAGIEGNPNSAEAKAMFTRRLYVYAKDKGIPMGKEFDLTSTSQQTAAGMFNADHDGSKWAKVKATAQQVITGATDAQAFFNLSAHDIQQQRTKALNDITSNDFYRYTPLEKRDAVLYNLLPSKFKNAQGKNGGYTLQGFSALPSQQKYDMVAGNGAIQVPGHVDADVALVNAFKDPKFVSSLSLQMGAPIFSDPSNAASFAKVSAGQRGMLAATAGAAAPYDRGQGPTPAGNGLGPSTATANYNPNTPLAHQGENGYSVVGQPSKVPSPGATPEGPAARDFAASFTKKTGVQSDQLKGLRGVMQKIDSVPATTGSVDTSAIADTPDRPGAPSFSQ